MNKYLKAYNVRRARTKTAARRRAAKPFKVVVVHGCEVVEVKRFATREAAEDYKSIYNGGALSAYIE